MRSAGESGTNRTALDLSVSQGPWLEIVGVVPDLVLDANAPLKLDNPAKKVV
jgi:hypothetical protein